MKGLTSRLVTGIAFAIFATLCWALNFYRSLYHRELYHI